MRNIPKIMEIKDRIYRIRGRLTAAKSRVVWREGHGFSLEWLSGGGSIGQSDTE